MVLYRRSHSALFERLIPIVDLGIISGRRSDVELYHRSRLLRMRSVSK